MSIKEDREVVTVQHALPELNTLELDNGDCVFYNPDNEDEWLQSDPDHCVEMDGRWR